MNRILVSIYFPAICRAYDVYLPCEAEISQITDMLKVICGELTENMFVSSDSSLLYDRKTGNALDVNSTPDELCLINGSELMFI